MRAYIIVDLGFGDAGKGLLTDFLARRCNAGLVVRYNGGAQAGHNVVIADGRHHTFSQFGSGTFIPGVKTYLSKYVVVHPGALLVEGDVLVRKGVRDAFARLRLSDQALIITPYHQAANRIKEIVRAQNRHGSCGVGVGEAVEDSLVNPHESVLAGDVANLPVLRRKMQAIRERKRAQLLELCKDGLKGEPLAREWQIFEREDVFDAWASMVRRMGELGLVTPDELLRSWLRETETTIFEGAQGILLDAEAGFHPFTTWSRCTSANASAIIREIASDSQVFQIGVMRTYAVRHGPGPLPTETPELAGFIHEHNQQNEWQGNVRYGWFDAVLARYALSLTGKLDALAVTHLDLLPKLKTWRYCTAYGGPAALAEFAGLKGANDMLCNIRLPQNLTLVQRERLTYALSAVTPQFETCDVNEAEIIPKIEALIEQPVGIVSRGPKAEDMEAMCALPV